MLDVKSDRAHSVGMRSADTLEIHDQPDGHALVVHCVIYEPCGHEGPWCACTWGSEDLLRYIGNGTGCMFVDEPCAQCAERSTA